MIKLIDIKEPDEEKHSKALRLSIKGYPTDTGHKALMESALTLNEGKEKTWGDGYTYRLDRRPLHHGGDQLHINHRNQAWAYRHMGGRSEPTKYTLTATNTVKDIVSHIFGVPRDIIEVGVDKVDENEILLEVSFR